jgi:CheY-like chemotaxis protein
MATRKKILVFDDNKEILELCVYILEDAGYNIKTSDTALDVENQVNEFMPDLILMDNWLGEYGGVEATLKIKQNAFLEKIPVIYFSANNDISVLAKQAGADAYLSKPFDIVDLETIVSKYINKN